MFRNYQLLQKQAQKAGCSIAEFSINSALHRLKPAQHSALRLADSTRLDQSPDRELWSKGYKASLSWQFWLDFARDD